MHESNYVCISVWFVRVVVLLSADALAVTDDKCLMLTHMKEGCTEANLQAIKCDWKCHANPMLSVWFFFQTQH